MPQRPLSFSRLVAFHAQRAARDPFAAVGNAIRQARGEFQGAAELHSLPQGLYPTFDAKPFDLLEKAGLRCVTFKGEWLGPERADTKTRSSFGSFRFEFQNPAEAIVLLSASVGWEEDSVAYACAKWADDNKMALAKDRGGRWAFFSREPLAPGQLVEHPSLRHNLSDEALFAQAIAGLADQVVRDPRFILRARGVLSPQDACEFEAQRAMPAPLRPHAQQILAEGHREHGGSGVPLPTGLYPEFSGAKMAPLNAAGVSSLLFQASRSLVSGSNREQIDFCVSFRDEEGGKIAQKKFSIDAAHVETTSHFLYLAEWASKNRLFLERQTDGAWRFCSDFHRAPTQGVLIQHPFFGFYGAHERSFLTDAQQRISDDLAAVAASWAREGALVQRAQSRAPAPTRKTQNEEIRENAARFMPEHLRERAVAAAEASLLRAETRSAPSGAQTPAGDESAGSPPRRLRL